MNKQMEYFRNLIVTAGENDKEAIQLLRDICRSAAEKAPVSDLIKMAQFLYDLRAEAEAEYRG